MGKYRFDQIAVNSTAKRKPTEEDMKTYVGLEHLDTGSLTVKRWGSDVPIKGDKLIMKKGDVLLGKRNAYLRRAAIAPHDGLFSAHGMILNPIENVVDKDFFPMFIASDYFFDAAIAISVGSLSPTINWRDLAKLEFDLPPIEEQRKLAKVLWSMDETIEAYEELLLETDELVKAQYIEMFGDPSINPNGWIKISVKDAVKKGYIARPLDGNHGAKHPKGTDYVSEGVPFIMAKDLKDNMVDFDGCYFITEEQAKTLTKGWAKTGDVLLTHKGTIGRTAVVQPSDYDEFLLTPQVTYYRCLKDIDKEYLAAYFNTNFFIDQMDKLVTGTTRACVTITQQEKLELIIPPIEMQREFVLFVNKCEKSKAAMRDSIDSLKSMKRSIVVEAFNAK
jgi:type I restriction enzyme S subunit